MTDGEAPTLLVQSSEFEAVDDHTHVERVVIPEDDIPIPRILDMLGDRGVQSLLVEGGLDTWSRFLGSGLVDIVRTSVSPIELPYEDAKRFDSVSLEKLGFEPVSRDLCGGDEVTIWKIGKDTARTSERRT